MSLRFRWLTLSLSIVGVSAFAALIPPTHFASSSRIRVRLAEAEKIVTIKGYDLKIQDGSEINPVLTHDSAGLLLGETDEWVFHCQGSRIRALTRREGAALDLHSPVVINSPAGMLRYRSHPFRDEIRIYAKGSQCEVVNELDIEKYLAGIVNAEFSSQWNEEAVKAQVIAARTYAYFQLKSMRTHQPTSHYDVDSTIRDQVYDGYSSEDFRGSRAVEKTRGIVLMIQDPKTPGSLEPIKAFYHSSCAGQTELPENVWGSHFAGFNQSVSCPFCKQSAKVAWSLDLEKPEIEKAFQHGAFSQGSQKNWPKKWRDIIRQGDLIEIQPGATDPAHHRLEILSLWRWQGAQYSLPLSAVRFRDWIGTTRLKSTVFDLRHTSSDSWHLEGRGSGHGVGMCQLGAKYLGENGYKTALILKHYYPDAVMAKMW